MPSIFNWKCSHYKNCTRKWINGKLRLQLTNIVFIGDNVKIIFDFNDICEVKKATSSLIYSCVVFKIQNEFLWFSSFSNRDNVFNTIEYFWKQQLCGPIKPSIGSGSRLSNELLRIAHGTQDSLMEAANTLHVQGKQINKAAVTMNMVHNDLTVAERVADDLDSYFSAWHVKGPSTKVNNLVLEREDISIGTDRIEYSILFANLAQESHKPGYIVLNNNSIDILNDISESIFVFSIIQLPKIDVNSPWDINLTKRTFGRPDICLHVISTNMPNIIQTLQRVYDVELDYHDLPDDDDYDGDDDYDNVKGAEISRTELLPNENPESSHGNQTQLCSEDQQQLSKVLNNVKSMALNIGVEQDAQLKQIELLNDSVDKAQSRIKSTDWKVKKMT